MIPTNLTSHWNAELLTFSDGRNNISAGNVSIIFGDNVSDYVAAYPDGTPIVLYMGNVTRRW